MNVVSTLLLVQLLALVAMGVAYAISRQRRDLGWVDVGWSAGLGAAALLLAAITPGPIWRRGLVAGLALLWALRLTTHILTRLRSGIEDARYQALRSHWGSRSVQNARLLFLAESLLITLFALPLLVAMSNPRPTWTLWDGLGVLVWMVSVFGESVADRQLARFRKRAANRTTTCREGLWAYSRHPNYFFEWTHWFAYPLLAIGAPGVGWSLVGPVVMFGFLFKLTGIPFAEKQALQRRGDDYRRYQNSTSVFFPWFPRTEKDTPC